VPISNNKREKEREGHRFDWFVCACEPDVFLPLSAFLPLVFASLLSRPVNFVSVEIRRRKKVLRKTQNKIKNDWTTTRKKNKRKKKKK
jgi:hypothetical protein